jgi:putative endonuclease
MNRYYVYILSNVSRMLYTGMTNDLASRVRQHKEKHVEGFTRRYNLHRLVYYEEFQDVRKAIAREKEIKSWRRDKKIA